MPITITEALAEIPTIDKRIQKKKEFVCNFLFRQSAVRDPHEKDGGSEDVLKRELQSITDLTQRKITIRLAITQANLSNHIVIEGQTKTIAEWLTWRREVAPTIDNLYQAMAQKFNEMRTVARQQGLNVSDKDAGFSKDFVTHFSEKELAELRDVHEKTIGLLDGQLSLKNATILLDI